MSSNLSEVLEAFNDAFSNQRQQEVMAFFADNCEFRELNGHVAQGKPAVEAAIAKIFSGAYGKMTFIKTAMLVDEAKKEVCFSWRCQHEMLPVAHLGWLDKLTAGVLKLLYGKVFHWEGMDYFIFNDDLKIVSKQTYGKASMAKFVRGAVS